MGIGPTEYNLLFGIGGFLNIFMPFLAGVLATVCGRKYPFRMITYSLANMGLITITLVGQVLASMGTMEMFKSYPILLVGETIMQYAEQL